MFFSSVDRRWSAGEDFFVWFSLIFNNFSLGLAQPTSTPSSCARSVKAKMPFLCRFTKKGRKKRNQRLPPLETAPSAVLKKRTAER